MISESRVQRLIEEFEDGSTLDFGGLVFAMALLLYWTMLPILKAFTLTSKALTACLFMF